MSARDEILARVRAALADAPAPDAPAAPRAYRRRGERTPDEVIALFAERVAAYRAQVRRVTVEQLPAAIAAALTGGGARRVVAPANVPAEWRVDGFAWCAGDALDARALDRVDAVLTGCAVAVAETGTIALDGGEAQGPRALTLVPDHHVCVVGAAQIVELLPEALERLAPSARAGHPITLIAGPSATSDIELIRVEGVHGPRRLDVLLVGSMPSRPAASDASADVALEPALGALDELELISVRVPHEADARAIVHDDRGVRE